MVRFNDKPQIENSALSDTDIMPITDLEDSASDKKISIGQLKEYLSENLTNFADIDLVNTDMLADAIIEAPNGVIVANSSNNAIIAKQGLKLLFANGRKANNKFNNLEYTLENDISQSVVSMANGNYVVFLTSAGSLGYIPITEIYVSSEQPQVSTTNAYWYDVISNYWKRTSTSGATWVNTIINILGQVTITNNLLTTVTPNTLAYIPIPETLTIRDLSNITTAGEKKIKDLVQPNINTAVNNASNIINAIIDSVNSNLQTQISKNRADINTLDVGGAIEKTPSKLKTALLLSTIMDKPISDVDIFNILMDKKRSTFDRSKFTVVGSPTITDDGIASGFSTSGYLRTQNIDLSRPFKIKGKVFSASEKKNSCFCVPFSLTNQVGWGNYLLLLDTTLTFYYKDTNNDTSQIKVSSVITQNNEYEYELYWDGQIYGLKLFQNGVQIGNTATLNSTLPMSNSSSCQLTLGVLDGDKSFYTTSDSKIDLSQFSIEVDDKEVFNGNKTGVDQIKKDDYTVVGTPTISADGIASGFSSTSHIDATGFKMSDLAGKSWEVQGDYDFYTDGEVTSNQNQCICSLGQNYVSFGGAVHRRDSNETFNNIFRLIITAGTSGSGNSQIYYLEHKFSTNGKILWSIAYDKTNSKYTLKFTEPNSKIYKYQNQWIPTVENKELYSINIYPNNSIRFGKQPDNGYLTKGSIDLNSFKIYVDGNLVYQPTLRIPYTQSKTGCKIVDAVYRDRVQDMYEQFGYTHYYTIGDEPEKYNVSVVGSPTISEDGIASGFSTSDYINTNFVLPLVAKNYKAEIKFSTSDDVSTAQILIGSDTNLSASSSFSTNNLFIERGYLGVRQTTTGTSWDIALHNIIPINTNTNYSLTVEWNGTSYKYTLYENDVYIKTTTASNSNFYIQNTLYLGNSAWFNYTRPFLGSIDLSQFSIEVDGKEVFRGYEPAIVDAYTLATHRNSDIIETFSDNSGTYYEVRADLVQRCVGIIPPQTTQVNYPRAFREDKNIVQVSYFDVGDSTSTLTLDHIAPKTQTKAGFTIGSTQTANRNYYAEGKAILG